MENNQKENEVSPVQSPMNSFETTSSYQSSETKLKQPVLIVSIIHKLIVFTSLK